MSMRSTAAARGGKAADRPEAPRIANRCWRRGDLFICCSDGAVELTDDHESRFGLERLEQATRAARHQEPGSVIASVWAALERFHRGRPPEDDITILALRRL